MRHCWSSLRILPDHSVSLSGSHFRSFTRSPIKRAHRLCKMGGESSVSERGGKSGVFPPAFQANTIIFLMKIKLCHLKALLVGVGDLFFYLLFANNNQEPLTLRNEKTSTRDCNSGAYNLFLFLWVSDTRSQRKKAAI